MREGSRITATQEPRVATHVREVRVRVSIEERVGEAGET